MSPVAELCVTIFTGFLGGHYFVKGKVGLGILYLLTFGLFGIGWIVDCVKAAMKVYTISKSKTEKVQTETGNIVVVTSVNYYEDIKEDEECASDTVTAVAQKLSTVKALREFQSYVVIDFETTGLSAKSDKAIEVACLKVIDGKQYEYQTLIDPQRHIPSRITKINGITDADVSGCPTIDSVAKQIYNFCDNLPFVAHNASFDMGFLKQAYMATGIETNMNYVDTLKLARVAFPEYNTHKLEFLIQELCLAEKQTHRAMDDVHCTKKLLDRCIDKIIEQKQIAKQNRKNAACPS